MSLAALFAFQCTPTFRVVSDETKAAGAGTLGGDGTSLTITKAGTIKIEVKTARKGSEEIL